MLSKSRFSPKNNFFNKKPLFCKNNKIHKIFSAENKKKHCSKPPECERSTDEKAIPAAPKWPAATLRKMCYFYVKIEKSLNFMEFRIFSLKSLKYALFQKHSLRPTFFRCFGGIWGGKVIFSAKFIKTS